jgi:cobalt transporter subunit CbtA
MDIFRRIFFAALCAGLFSGLLITIAHQFGTVPIILEAEIYEKAAEAHGHPGVAHEQAEHGMAMEEMKPDGDAQAWEPADGLERTFYTGVADILTGVGFALLLVSAYTVTGGKVNWRSGMLWGMAGYVAFAVAPSLGLPPEVPGTAAAPLLDRQIWWLATVLLTGGGLFLLAFKRNELGRLLALVMIALPHLIGAPHLLVETSAAPEALAHRFIVTTLGIGLLFWLSLGGATGFCYCRLMQKK